MGILVTTTQVVHSQDSCNKAQTPCMNMFAPENLKDKMAT